MLENHFIQPLLKNITNKQEKLVQIRCSPGGLRKNRQKSLRRLYCGLIVLGPQVCFGNERSITVNYTVQNFY
jgi:hypothetical protein